MDESLRGKGNYSIDQIMSFSGCKAVWLELEKVLEEDYNIEKIIIKNSKTEGWGINYRVGKDSLCYIHPERNGIFIVFQIREDVIEKVMKNLSDYALKVWDVRYPCDKGGWMWYRLVNSNQIEDVRILLNLKIKPKIK